MNTPETQSPIDTTDIPIDNIGNRKTLRKKGSASTNETQLRDGPVQRSAAEQNPAVFAAADAGQFIPADVQYGGLADCGKLFGKQCFGGGKLVGQPDFYGDWLFERHFFRRRRDCRPFFWRAG